MHGFLNLDAFVEKLIVESEVAVDGEVEVGAEVELAPHTDGRSDPLAYVILTTCRSCWWTVFVWDNTELDTLPSIIYSW